MATSDSSIKKSGKKTRRGVRGRDSRSVGKGKSQDKAKHSVPTEREEDSSDTATLVETIPATAAATPSAEAGSVNVAPRTTTTAMKHAALALRTVAAAQTTEPVDETYVAALKIRELTEELTRTKAALARSEDQHKEDMREWQLSRTPMNQELANIHEQLSKSRHDTMVWKTEYENMREHAYGLVDLPKADDSLP